MTEPAGRRSPSPHPSPHPAYRRLATPDHPAGRPDDHPHWNGQPAALPRRGGTCPDCDATRGCCQCRSDVGDLRRFARRMAELHQHTGTPLCGCGAHACYIRRRLDDIRPGAGT
ncbi:MAG TPA: hypothetical protein VFX70_05280 [Mycobacteriales bacterium]|nr:hypothetical protein [Mycobacteriales bacterium]